MISCATSSDTRSEAQPAANSNARAINSSFISAFFMNAQIYALVLCAQKITAKLFAADFAFFPFRQFINPFPNLHVFFPKPF